MDFSKVIKWNIPEGDILRVIDSSDRIIWEKVQDLSIIFRDNIPLQVTYDYNFDDYKELSGFYSDVPFTVGIYNRVKPGAKFKSWNENLYGTGKEYFIGDSVSSQTDMTLYAQWENISDIELDYIVVNCPDDSYSVPYFHISAEQETSRSSYIELLAHADPTLPGGTSRLFWNYPPLNQNKRILYIKSAHGTETSYNLNNTIDVWRGSEPQKTYRLQRWYSVNGGYGAAGFGDPVLSSRGNAYRMIDDYSYSTTEDRIGIGMNMKPNQRNFLDHIISPKGHDITKVLETYIFATKSITSSGVGNLRFSDPIDDEYTFESYTCTTNRNSTVKNESPIFLYRPYYEHDTGRIYLKDTNGTNPVYGDLFFPGRDQNKYYPLTHDTKKYKITGYDFEGNSYVYEFQGA